MVLCFGEPAWWNEPTSNHAYMLSLISIVITLIAAIGGIIGYAKLDDSLILIYGLENIVDFFSSAIVLWRFNTSTLQSTAILEMTDIEQQQLQQRISALASREKRASIGVSIVLAILGLGGLITAIDDLSKGLGVIDLEKDYDTIYFLSFISFVVFGILAKFKFHYATLLKSPSLRKDGICSAIGAILGFAMFFSVVLTMMSSAEMWWWLDPTVALFCGLGALCYGLYGMHKAYVKDGYPIFSCAWWIYGGEKMDQSGQPPIGGGLELQQQQQQRTDPNASGNESIQGNPSLTDPSVTSLSMMPSKSVEEEMSDIVIT
jgi:hypothetical protein